MAGDSGTLSKEVGDEEEDLDMLETELDRMAAAVLESRTTLPDVLSSTMSSILAARRPSAIVSDLGPSNHADHGKREWAERAVEEKARLVKEEKARNASEMRTMVERLRECAARMEKLRSSSSSSSACNGINSIHPAFKRKKMWH